MLPTLRLYIVVSAISPVVTLRLMDRLLGMHGSFLEIIRADVLFFVVLMAYTSWPWLRREMGGAFLPVALIVKTAQALVGTYLASSPFVPGNMWENFVPIAMLRLAVHCQMIVIFTAWQYELVWPMAVGAALTAINAAAAFPYVKAGGALYPLYVAIVTIEFMMASGSGLAIGLLMRNQRRQAAELDKRNRKLAEYASMTEQLAVTQERNRLARELHDTLAHSLSAVAVQIEAAQALSEVDAAAEHKMLEQALQTTRSGLTDARRSLHALRASPLQDLGLSLAVRDLAESAAARAGLKLDLHIGSHLENLMPAVEQCLYRVAQEALTNVARHANAASVQVALARENGHVRLTVRDDGRGFDTAAVADTRYGLKGLRERAETVGGTLVVESERDKGTKVALEIATA